MAEVREVQVGLSVLASGQDGRFEVVEIKGHVARIRLLANKKDTGEPVELNYIIEVPISALIPLEELRHWRLVQCKICGGSHSDPEPAVIPPVIGRNSMPFRVEQSVECPRFPGKSAIYKHNDWLLLTDSEFKAAQPKQTKKNYMLHITHHRGPTSGMQPEYSMTCAASPSKEATGAKQAVHFPSWDHLHAVLDSVHCGGDELRKAKKSLDEHGAYTMPELWLEDDQLIRLGFSPS